MCKAAFHLLEVLHLRTESTCDTEKIVDSIIEALKDTAEDKLVLCLNILLKLSTRSCSVVLSRIEPLIAALEKLFALNLKLVAAQDRCRNIIASVTRVCYTIEHSPELAEAPAPKFADFMKNKILGNKEKGGVEAKELYDTYAE